MVVKKYYVTVDDEGTIRWYEDAECSILHRENGPAIECTDGSKYWYQNGQKHRENGPAIEWASGSKEWWQNGQLHRENGPAVERRNGTKGWFISGKQLSKAAFLAATQPTVEMSVADVEKLVGKRVKIIK